jgi:RimJ/RimL family protein N-acetyltransferase
VPEIPLPDPPLEDDSIALRRWEWDDAPVIIAACQDPEIPRWTEIPSPYTEREAHEFLARLEPDRRAGRAIGLAVAAAKDGGVLGACGLQRFDWGEGRAEIGYWVAREARERSVGTRAARLLSEWALRQLALDRIELLANPGNVASQKLAEDAGFTREGLLRSYRRREDFVMFSLLESDL